MIIYWKRLKTIAEEIVNKKVEIIMNIENSDLRGAIQSNGKIIIYLNMSYNKSIDDIIKTLAHEITHFILQDEEHTNEFIVKCDEIEKIFKVKYFKKEAK
jgi:Zn-dependent peptidase ImmA (M78 family)